jgi:phosphatidylserine/phosphatidylglycerophosphate/cardiolipin synthase-like enzyme
MSGTESPAARTAAPPAAQRRIKFLLLTFFAAWLGLSFWNAVKPLPPGMHVASRSLRITESDVDFLYDSAAQPGQPAHREIFAHVFAAVDRAEQLLVLDFFLLNDFGGSKPSAGAALPLAAELTQHLLARKRSRPNLKIVLVTDPINEIYGARRSPYLVALEKAGVIVVRTRLDRLRDSNPLYSGLWRLLFAWWGDLGSQRGWLANPFDDGPRDVSLSAWLRLLNFKADHRKLLAADDGAGGWMSIVTSANPHDAGGANGNVALQMRGPIAREILNSELAIATWSADDDRLPAPPAPGVGGVGSIDARFLTEGAIRDALTEAIAAAGGGDEICMALFYFSDRQVVRAVLQAAARGARVRVLLDPNRDAFGRAKDGVPNQPVAAELVQGGGGRIDVRWYRTRGKQFHTKIALVRHRTELWMTLGSANFTRRNLDDFNLEANIELRLPPRAAPARAAAAYFDGQWAVAAPYLESADAGLLKYWRYRFMELSGLSTF